jgi:hypothetical protein
LLIPRRAESDPLRRHGNLIVFGGRTTITQVGTVGFYPCPNCQNYAPFSLHHRRVWFTLFWIPLIPYHSDFFLACDICSRGAVLTRQQAQAVLNETARAAQAVAVGQVTGDPAPGLAPQTAAAFAAPPAVTTPKLPATVPRAVWIGGAIIAGIIVVSAIASNGNSGTNPLTGSNPPDPQITGNIEQFTGANSAEATGTVTNRGGDMARSLIVYFYVEDNGQRVASGQQSIGDLNPGASSSYDIRLNVPGASFLANPVSDIQWNWLANSCPSGTIASPDPSGNGDFCMSVVPSLAPS